MQIKLLQFNVQDLFLDLQYPVLRSQLDQLSESQWQLHGKNDVQLKPLAKCHQLAAVISIESPDICLLSEVGGKDSLETFNTLFLNDQYQPLILEGLSKRGIHNAFLVKRTFRASCKLTSHGSWPAPFYYEHESPKRGGDLRLDQLTEALDLGSPEERTISRDILELRIKPEHSAPEFAVLVTHLKSGYDPAAIDPGGISRRAAEVLGLIDLYRKLKAELDMPVLIGGDFNGNASRDHTADEFKPIYAKTDLEDVLWLAKVPRHERITHLTFPRRQVSAKQLDYIFLPQAFHKHLAPDGAYVHRYHGKGPSSTPDLPLSFADRHLLPSDHFPVVCILRFS